MYNSKEKLSEKRNQSVGNITKKESNGKIEINNNKQCMQKNPGGKIKLKCCFSGCKHNNTTLLMKCAQERISDKKNINKETLMQAKKSYYCKKLLQGPNLQRYRVKKDIKKDYRICENHSTEEIKKILQ